MLLVITIISMLALGWLVWRTVQRQEANDEAFQEMLEKDDRRARAGRERLVRELARDSAEDVEKSES